MMDSKPWYEKVSMWISIIAGICTIIGISVFGIIKGIAKNETNDVQDAVNENEDKSSDISVDKNDNSYNNESFLNETNGENMNMENDLKELENINLELENKNEQLKNENDKLHDENDQLEKEVDSLVEKIKELTSDNDSYDDQVSIFTLETFSGKGGWKDNTYSGSSFTDTYGNTYSSAHEATHIWEESSIPNKPPVYLLDKKYSKCIGQLAWPKDQKDMEGYIWIEFYADDELIYKTEEISAGDRVLSFEFSVEDVEKLKIYRKATRPSVRAIYPYLNLIK